MAFIALHLPECLGTRKARLNKNRGIRDYLDKMGQAPSCYRPYYSRLSRTGNMAWRVGRVLLVSKGPNPDGFRMNPAISVYVM